MARKKALVPEDLRSKSSGEIVNGSPSNSRSEFDGRVVHVHPKKRLGQHFLRSKEVGERIVESLAASKNDTVIEIGAGTGELTKLIAREAGRVIAVEVDETCFPRLRLLADLNKNLELFLDDVRHLKLADFGKVLVLGNLPYHLSSEILFWLLGQRDDWKRALLTVQAEFAERLTAEVGSHHYSALSVVTQAFLRVDKLFDIDRRAFVPPPKVRSTAIRIQPLEAPLWKGNPESFSKQVRSFFAHRRKTLVNNLRMMGVESAEKSIQDLGISPTVRPQELKAHDYVKLIDRLG